MAKAVTVLGEVSPEQLGVVLPHEHLLWDQICWGHPAPQELGDRAGLQQAGVHRKPGAGDLPRLRLPRQPDPDGRRCRRLGSPTFSACRWRDHLRRFQRRPRARPESLVPHRGGNRSPHHHGSGPLRGQLMERRREEADSPGDQKGTRGRIPQRPRTHAGEAGDSRRSRVLLR